MKTKLLIICLGIFWSYNTNAQKKFKQLMKDKNVNFYEVVEEAENYFKTHDKNVNEFYPFL